MPDPTLQRRMQIAESLTTGVVTMDIAAAVVDFDCLGDEFCRLIEWIGDGDTVVE